MSSGTRTPSACSYQSLHLLRAAEIVLRRLADELLHPMRVTAHRLRLFSTFFGRMGSRESNPHICPGEALADDSPRGTRLVDLGGSAIRDLSVRRSSSARAAIMRTKVAKISA